MADFAPFLISAGVFAGLSMLVLAALHDVMARTVPNSASVLIAICGLLVQLARATLADDGLQGFGLSVLAALAVLVVMKMFWHRGYIGGADVKLLSATALLVPPGLVMNLLAATAIFGSVVAFCFLAARRRLPRPPPGRPASFIARIVRIERWRLRRGGPLPYAVAIASGACFVLSHGVPT